MGALARVALISSPRSGNTWTRLLLKDACGLEQLAENNPWDVDWGALPDRCVLQMHCHRTDEVLEQLAQHAFRMVHLARHPMDVLISILQCCESVPETAAWLNGEAGDESSIKGATPQSAAFVEYACSLRAKALLSVSPQWWYRGPGTFLRYEDLVADTVGELERLVDEVGIRPVTELRDVVERNGLGALRRYHPQFFWRGQPGIWSSLLTSGQTALIAACHRRVLDVLSYACDADEALSSEQAELSWRDLA